MQQVASFPLQRLAGSGESVPPHPTSSARRDASVPRNRRRRTDFSTSGPPRRSRPHRPHRAATFSTGSTRPQHRTDSGSAGGRRRRLQGVGPMTKRATCSSGAPWDQRTSARRRCRARPRREAHRPHRAEQLPAPSGAPQSTQRHSCRHRCRQRLAGVPPEWAAMLPGCFCSGVFPYSFFPHAIENISTHTVGHAPRPRQAATRFSEEILTFSVKSA